MNFDWSIFSGWLTGFTMTSCYLFSNHVIMIAHFEKKNQFHLGLYKGPVKQIKRVKIAHSFLESVSDQFHVIILSLPM